MPSPSSSRLAATIVIFSSFGAVAVVFWTQHLVVLSLTSTATKVGFLAKRSRPKRTSTSRNRRERGQRNRSSKLKRKRQRWTKTAYDKFEDFVICLQNTVHLILFSMMISRFNLSFQESIDDNDDSDEGKYENGRPCFSEIERSAGFLDKELAASGFNDFLVLYRKGKLWKHFL
ncbi:uncharacterized protein LOC130949151 [Arachis stenosperma]|uniref:uncharacterized protein LOC130949151 n=1 Tax=Arachis stenosperma TaxID=217475 RepID=UPI0025ACCE4C|nr:uncharacterized protein LOC130949151 [Arachis stenosperma]